MEKVRPWCGQLSDRGRLKNRNREQEERNQLLSKQTNHGKIITYQVASLSATVTAEQIRIILFATINFRHCCCYYGYLTWL